ncbi:urea transporter 2-like [Paramacrobiotus metropolitanus]|uniref:urea transporter 2-like n=1 Tax=Paramacrobiotus metropolitanus TaxID=2943436 RepID=UPI002445666B|nr:urea transporter 2-like [Paramacrobiotus metropolitanus]XP_055341547.1 urea transporter 2-like [Paramacrobiotus metropolitanus]
MSGVETPKLSPSAASRSHAPSYYLAISPADLRSYSIQEAGSLSSAGPRSLSFNAPADMAEADLPDTPSAAPSLDDPPGAFVRWLFRVQEDGTSVLDHWWWQYVMGDCAALTKYVSQQRSLDAKHRRMILCVPIWYLVWLIDVMRGFGPPAFVNNPWSGILFVVAVGVQNIYILLFGILGLLCAAVTTYCLNVGRTRLHNGVAYFNGFLVGMFVGSTSAQRETKAFWFIFPVAFYGCLSGFLKVALDAICHVFHIHTMNLPFSVLALIHLGSQLAMPFAYFAGTGISTQRLESPLEDFNNTLPIPVTARTVTIAVQSIFDHSPQTAFHGIFHALGKVYFCDDRAPVILCWAALLVASPLLCLMAFVGAAVGAGVAMVLGVAHDPLFSGEYSLNALLVGMSLGGFFYVLNGYSFVVALLGAALSTCISGFLNHILETMKLPFFGLPLFMTNSFFLLASAANDTSERLHRVRQPSTHERNLVQYYGAMPLRRHQLMPTIQLPEAEAHVEQQIPITGSAQLMPSKPSESGPTTTPPASKPHFWSLRS